MLEEFEHARARGAGPLVEIIGGAMNNDAYHMTAPEPNGDGAMHSMRFALESSGLAPEEVSHINAHGTSTGLGDIAETKAIKMAFGERAYDVPISATKSMHGHAFGRVLC